MAYGDSDEILRLNLDNFRWDKLNYDVSSSVHGTLKYSGITTLYDGRIIMCGGSLVSTGDATNIVYEAQVNKPNKFIRKKSMLKRRYAHVCCNLNGYVYVIGGFDNRDADEVPANTLDHCERYSIHENKWIECAVMEDPRGFAAGTTVKD